MKRSNSISKGYVFRKLAMHGLTASRVTKDGKRVWLVSDGKEYDSLADISANYKAQD